MIKAIIATALGAAVTAGVVYVAMKPAALDKLPNERPASAEREAYDDTSETKAKIDDLITTPVNVGDDTEIDDDVIDDAAIDDAVIDDAVIDDAVIDDATDEAKPETKVMVTNEAVAPDTNTQDLPKDMKLNPKPNLVTVEGGDIEAALNEEPDTQNIAERTDVDITRPARSSEMPLPNPEIPSRLVDEADKITEPRLRDQAYLSIVDYGLGISDFKGAWAVIDKIENTEYRFTAQSNLAIAYARAGNSEAAFDVVGSIQDAEFADIVRMQVIESLSGRDAPN